jgi:hypothetical protein
MTNPGEAVRESPEQKHFFVQRIVVFLLPLLLISPLFSWKIDDKKAVHGTKQRQL